MAGPLIITKSIGEGQDKIAPIDTLFEIMDRRRQQTIFRLVMMILIMIFFRCYLPSSATLLIGAVYVLLQVWEFFVLFSLKARNDPTWRSFSLITIMLNSVAFGLPSALWGIYGGQLGIICGAYLLSGAIMNSVHMTRSCRSALIASVTPFILYVTCSAYLAAGQGIDWKGLSTVSIGGAMMSLTALNLWIDTSRTRRSEQAALLDLSRREADLAAAVDHAQTANAAKSAFLATMSHEIRTPLNGVLGMVQAMQFGELPAVQRERLDVIRDSGRSLLAILDDLLDLSKIEACKLELEAIAFDLRAIAAGAHGTFTSAANAKGLSFNVVIHPDAEGVYRGDPTRLRQVLYNLISNAVKFTAEGSIVVTVRRPAERLIIEVADTGIGITPEQLNRLFVTFVQADTSTTRKYGGSGLGLSIAKKLTELMGGDIRVETTAGKGSTFIVNIDLEKISDKSAEPTVSRAPAAMAVDSGMLRVLAAEDNAVNQLVLKTLLLQIDVTPTIVANGRQAVEAWSDAEWDLILMDVHMPEMDGLQATREIRRREQADARPRTPIIALTANAMAHQISAYHEVGMDAFVAKPIDATALYAAIEQTALGAYDEGPDALAEAAA